MTNVRPFLRVVANGVADGTRLKATVIATPEPSPEGFELADWPAQVAKLLRDKGLSDTKFGVRLYVREVDPASSSPTKGWSDATAEVVAHKKLPDPKTWAAVTKLWQASLAPRGTPRWGELADDIARSLAGDKHAAALETAYAPPPNPPSAFSTDGALLAQPPKTTDRALVKGVVAVRQGDYAVDEERLRAARVILKMQGGPDLPGDRLSVPELEASGLGADARLALAKQKLLYGRFLKAVDATNDERLAASDAFKAVEGIVKGAAGANPADCAFRADCSPAPAAARAGEPADKRPTHSYGLWLQRSRDLDEAAIRARNNRTTDKRQEEDSRNATGDLEQIRGVFYSLQGDPQLSRLFCLAFDVEFALPDALRGARYLHLAAEPEEQAGRMTPRVLTAAKRDAGAFWPVSIFEAGVSEAGTPISAPSLVEQRDGVGLLGAGYSTDRVAHAPQYDLVSLDIRQAIDTKPRGVDGGQRHLTAGFTVMDRGRRRQIARDLAVAALQAPAAAPAVNAASRREVVLHAEELTIGRRVDVASPAAGTPVADIEWRSLMHRFVRYGKLDPNAEAALRTLWGAKPSDDLPDESSFQVAARFMPMIGPAAALVRNGRGGNDVPLEAVAEEAIFLWDGTPAAVLTDPGPAPEKPGLALPFQRAYALPTSAKDAALRPPPLRYGAPYVFGFRSTFLGGGSPTVSQARSSRAATPGAILPPPIGGKVVPRRFLRHEGVSPPILLLPTELATKRFATMGFEQADQAFVRSAPQPKAGAPAAKPPAENQLAGPPRIPVGLRMEPVATRRVFVAPETTQSIVMRHGMLDGANAGAVSKGGLRDVAYEPARPEVGVSALAGFPTVTTRTAQSLTPEDALYVRERQGPNDLLAGGIPVFVPGVTRPLVRTGYLPDPAAEEMSIRARIRGSRRYLAGDIAVDLYAAQQGIVYPNALPLVLEVTRRTETRPAPAEAISELVVGEAGALRWVTEKGALTVGNPGKATRVRLVTLHLAEGEDYDLEIACLPRAAKLASTFSLPETIDLQHLHASLDPAAKAELERRCGPLDLSGCDPGGEPRLTGLGGHRLYGAAPGRRAAENLLKTMKTRWPIEEVAAVATLRACHAIAAPITPPVFVEGSVRARRVETWDKRCWSAEAPDCAGSPGAKTLVLTGTIKLDLEQIDAFEIVAETVAAAGRPIDDKTRSRSLIARRSGRWPRMTLGGGGRLHVPPRDVVGFDVGEDGRVELPREGVTLLRVENLPPRAAPGSGEGLFGETAGRETALSLERLYEAAIAGKPITVPIMTDAPAAAAARPADPHVIRISQPHLIADTMARDLRLRIVALSRFSEAFETAPVYQDKGEPMLRGRQALTPEEQSLASAPIEVPLPSTERPSACELRRPEPTFEIARCAVDAGQGPVKQVAVRTGQTRFTMGRGWHGSGPGERLGLVLWPPDYFGEGIQDADEDRIKARGRTMSLPTFEDRDLEAAGAFVTRWGGDPIRKDATPQSGFFIPTEAFADVSDAGASPHAPRVVARARMPVPRDRDERGREVPTPVTIDYLDVTLLTYEPCFDLDSEEWFVDVDLRPIRASEPLVRFGVVRYQENAIPPLQVSHPVPAEGQLMPKRTVSVVARRVEETKSHVVVVELEGLGAMGIKPFDLAAAFPDPKDAEKARVSLEQLKHPEMRVAVVHERQTAEHGLLRTPIRAGPDPWRRVVPKIENATLHWRIDDIEISDERLDELGPGTLVAYVEEIDRRMAASYANEPIGPGDLFDPKTFRESGPRFNARVAFLAHGLDDHDVDGPSK